MSQTRDPWTRARSAVRAHFEALWTPEDRRLVTAASYSLHFGPIPAGDEPDGDGWVYPGDDAAYTRARELAADLPSEVWYDGAGGDVITENPCKPWQDSDTGEWVEPYLDDIYTFERHDIARAVFGKDFEANILL